MPVAARLSQFLARKGIEVQQLHHDRVDSLTLAVVSSAAQPDHVIVGTMLIDLKGVVMAVHPLNSRLDLDAVARHTGRKLQLLTDQQADRLFTDCESGMRPPVPGAYGIAAIVDESILSLDFCYLASGCRTTLLRMDGRSLRLALAGSARGKIAIHRLNEEIDNGAQVVSLTLDDVAAKLQKLYRLPPMPAIALKILHLTSDDRASVRDLASLIEHDPSLSAQIMRYARSALFNYQGSIDTVDDAVSRVLGFDRVAHMAMGISASRAFNVPREGMLGLDAFWRHSLYCAFLSQRIADKLKKTDQTIIPGVAYLCGLLHNFGILLIGHLFPQEFCLLNKLREANPEQPLAALEKQVFGMGRAQDLITVGHGAIGGILHKLWQLPEAVVKAAGMHQYANYHGAAEAYVYTVQLANAILKTQAIGDEFDADDPEPYALLLGLDAKDLADLIQCAQDVAQELDALAHALAA